MQIGDVFAVQVADGRAYYRVADEATAELDDRDAHTHLVRVEWMDEPGMNPDGYTCPALRHGCWVERENIVRLVGYQKRLHALFGSQG